MVVYTKYSLLCNLLLKPTRIFFFFLMGLASGLFMDFSKFYMHGMKPRVHVATSNYA